MFFFSFDKLTVRHCTGIMADYAEITASYNLSDKQSAECLMLEWTLAIANVVVAHKLGYYNN